MCFVTVIKSVSPVNGKGKAFVNTFLYIDHYYHVIMSSHTSVGTVQPNKEAGRHSFNNKKFKPQKVIFNYSVIFHNVLAKHGHLLLTGIRHRKITLLPQYLNISER